MFKKFSAAAALAIFAAFSTAAYASSVGSAVEGAVDGVVNAGEDIVDGVVNAGEDVADGITGGASGIDNGIDNGVDPLTDTSGTGDVTDLKDGVPETSGTQSASDSDAVGDSSNEAKNPNTGISLGFAATSAVLAAMGVTLTTVRRKQD